MISSKNYNPNKNLNHNLKIINENRRFENYSFFENSENLKINKSYNKNKEEGRDLKTKSQSFLNINIDKDVKNKLKSNQSISNLRIINKNLMQEDIKIKKRK